jgi:hypothetical protein
VEDVHRRYVSPPYRHQAQSDDWTTVNPSPD